MAEYQIITEATSDLTDTMMEGLPFVEVIPMQLEMEGKEYMYGPGGNISAEEFYALQRAGKDAKTSSINYVTYYKFFEPYLEQGKDILYISFSSGLSSTYHSAVSVAENLKKQYPDRTIYVIDSLCASVGEGLLVYLAAQKQQEGYAIDDLKDWVEEKKWHLCHWFTVDDLNHLKKGGRVSTVTAVVGTTLKVKPILHVDDKGLLIPVANVMGRKKSLKSLVEHMIKTCEEPDGQTVFIGHADAKEDAEHVKQLVLKAFPGVKKVCIYPIGPVIGTHSGAGTVALFYLGSHK